MARENLNDLLVFLAIARERSFTRAAAKLGVSQSALSHTIKDLEARMGVRLLTRTTRSVSMTLAGEELYHTVSPRIEEIEAKIAALSDTTERPAGFIRITATDHAMEVVVWPKLKALLKAYPEIKTEMTVDYGLVDIVEERYDIGIRYGDQVEKDMIAARISPDLKMLIVGAPRYLEKRGVPRSPEDLLHHDCITLRMTTSKAIYAWELMKGTHATQVRVTGQLTFNTVPQMVSAVLEGFGLAYLPEESAHPFVQNGELVTVLRDWTPTVPGLHAYYPSRRQSSKAFNLVLEALKQDI